VYIRKGLLSYTVPESHELVTSYPLKEYQIS
jgi:hypothetical protein